MKAAVLVLLCLATVSLPVRAASATPASAARPWLDTAQSPQARVL